MKRIVCFTLTVALMLTLSGCVCIPNINIMEYFKNLGHTHVFSDATCTEPQVCECGETGEEALGHTWTEATCTEPQKCFCGATNGEALGHSWETATCTTPKTCKVCSIIEGDVVEHEYVDGVCKYCSATKPSVKIKYGSPYYIVSKDGKSISAYSFDEDGGLYIAGAYFIGEPMYDYEETITYNGKTYSSGGVGGPGDMYKIVGEEIWVYEFESTTEYQLKLIVDDNGNLVVTYTKYPDSIFGDVGTVWLSSLD